MSLSSLSGFRRHRLQFDRSGPFFAVFLSNSSAIGQQIRQKLSSLEPNFASMPKVRQAATFRPLRGFTLIELLVALAVMALLALLSWRGIEGIVRTHLSMRERMADVLSLQIGLTQWTTDLDALVETGVVSGLAYDGMVFRLTRRDSSSEGSPLRVVAWARPVGENGRSSWARWQSLPIRTRAELQQAWGHAQRWGQQADASDKSRQLALAGLDQWQIFYYRNNAWSNPLSTADPVKNNPVEATVPLPDAIRLVLTLSPGQPLSGVLTKDWLRPVVKREKS